MEWEAELLKNFPQVHYQSHYTWSNNWIFNKQLRLNNIWLCVKRKLLSETVMIFSSYKLNERNKNSKSMMIEWRVSKYEWNPENLFPFRNVQKSFSLLWCLFRSPYERWIKYCFKTGDHSWVYLRNTHIKNVKINYYFVTLYFSDCRYFDFFYKTTLKVEFPSNLQISHLQWFLA